jgi:hypothetical protein
MARDDRSPRRAAQRDLHDQQLDVKAAAGFL